MLESYVEALKRDIRTSFKMAEWTVLWRKWQFNNESVISIFRKIAAKNADKIAIRFEDQKWTFKQLDQFSNKIANCFVSFGFKAGDELALLMDNKPEFIGIWLGLAKVGIISAFINTNNRMDSLINSLNAFKCKAIIYDNNYYSALEDIYESLNSSYPSMKYFVWTTDNNNNDINCMKFSSKTFSDLLDNYSKNSLDVFHKRGFNDTLVYVFTSGTTGGTTKAAIETDARLIVGITGHHIGFGIRKDDNLYVSLPLYHAFGGIGGVGHCLIYGNTITIAKRFSVNNFWKDCIKHECTIGLYIGETCRYLLAQTPSPEDRQHSVRSMYGIGLRKEYWNQFKTRFGIKHIFEFYGASETNVYIVNVDDKEGSCGFIPYYYGIFLRMIYSGFIIKVDPITLEPIRNRKGLCKMIKPGEIGVIVGRHLKNNPIHNFKGYTDSEESKKKLIHNIRSIGDYGFMSGDLLEMDKFGYIYFKDRIGDTFRWKGENVSTTDVEAILQNYLNLKDCTVFGVSVGQCEGKAGMAVINTNSDEIDLDVLAQQMVHRLPSYAIPLFLRMTYNVELTGTYKLVKYKLQKTGFNPNLTNDLIYFFDKNTKKYIKLTTDLYELLEKGEIVV